MTDRVADDFSAIAARMRELRCEPVELADMTLWWCPDCQTEVHGYEVTSQERHDEGDGGCGCIVKSARAPL